MDWLNIPPLNSLKAFSAVAGTNSYTRAATQLNVTHAAVRQQVRSLENHLGISLVARHGRGMRLTPEGKTLAGDLETGFNIIQRAIEALTGADAARPVQITTSPAFAVEWLMPRIPEFQRAHPEITLMLNPTVDLIELKPGGIDVAIRYRDRSKLDKDVNTILVSDMVVVGATSLVGDRAFDDLSKLKDLPWLQELTTTEVVEWFNRRGITLDRPLIIAQMPGNLIMQGVRRGDGVSYSARAFFRDDITAGRMQVLHSEPATGIYYLETNSAPLRPAVSKFVDWLISKSETVTV